MPWLLDLKEQILAQKQIFVSGLTCNSEGTREASDQISFNKPGEFEDVRDHEQASRNS